MKGLWYGLIIFFGVAAFVWIGAFLMDERAISKQIEEDEMDDLP
jgi:prolipoprotein diacylglyceryltransferase